MAKEIENWCIDVEGFSHHKLGLAGMLFEACSSLLRQLIKGPAKSHLDTREYRSLRTEAHKFSLWGDGVGAKYGALDKILAESKHLRETVMYFLIACGKCLASLASQFPTSSQLSKICKEIKILQEQAESATVEAQKNTGSAEKDANQATVDETDMVASLMESFGLSDSESSTVSNETEDTVEYLKGYIDCLLDLTPALENPAKDLTAKDKISSLSEEKRVPAEARFFLEEIISRWPSIDKRFAQRLAEANWKRCENLRAQLLRPQVPDVVPDEVVEDEGPVLSEGLSSPTSRSLTLNSTFDYTAPSESSLATSFGDEDSSIIRRGIPKLPEGHEWGTSFRCLVCGDALRDVDSPARWKEGIIVRARVLLLTAPRKHVFNDIQPYICTYSECTHGVNTFVSQRAWVNHEFKIHRVDTSWTCLYCPEDIFDSAALCQKHIRQTHNETQYKGLSSYQRDDLDYAASRPRVQSQPAEKQKCPFCLTVVADTIQKFGAHVGQHLREIAVTAIPITAFIGQGADFEAYSGDETGNESDDLHMDGTSDSESLLHWILDNKSVPSLQSVRAAYNFSQRYWRCIGRTIPGRRCRLRISTARAHKFLETSKEVKESDNVDSIELRVLEILARNTLCIQWHQNQASRIAHIWLAEIESNSIIKSKSPKHLLEASSGNKFESPVDK